MLYRAMNTVMFCGLSFYSLLGVSTSGDKLNCVHRKELSTPFWEFLDRQIYLRNCSQGWAFYSLLGVSSIRNRTG